MLFRSPGNSNYVLVAGVGQPFVSGPWVYDGTAWTDIGTAGGKAPHVDYHAVAWDRANPTARLLVGNDGGIWRLENTTPPSLATAQWTDLNGNFLQITTFNGLIGNTMNGLKETGAELVIPTDSSKILPGYFLFIGFCLASLFLSKRLERGIKTWQEEEPN